MRCTGALSAKRGHPERALSSLATALLVQIDQEGSSEHAHWARRCVKSTRGVNTCSMHAFVVCAERGDGEGGGTLRASRVSARVEDLTFIVCTT